MQSSGARFVVCALAMSMAGLVSPAEGVEPKPPKKPTKLIKDQAPSKPSVPSFEDFESQYAPVVASVPQHGEDLSPWSHTWSPSVPGMPVPGEVPNPKSAGKKEDKTKGGPKRDQRFIGMPGIDPFFFESPLEPARRTAPVGYGFNYEHHPYELFFVVQPRSCQNDSEKKDSPEDVATKFLSSSGSPEPSRCTFAIAACCAPFNYHVRYPCFEMLGCFNAFWNINPCTEDIVNTAVKDVSTFYKNAPKSDKSDQSTTAAPGGGGGDGGSSAGGEGETTTEGEATTAASRKKK